MTTERQKAAVRYCEEWLQIEFKGDINSHKQVSRFLGENLDDAKYKAMELTCEYESYIWDLMND